MDTVDASLCYLTSTDQRIVIKGAKVNKRLLITSFLAGGAVGALVIRGPFPEWIQPRPSFPIVLLHTTVGFSFITVGLLASFRRPHNRVGPLMSAVGFAWFLLDLYRIDSAVTFTIAASTATFYQAILGHLFIVFPSGRTQSRLDQLMIRLIYGWFAFSSLLGSVFWDSQRDHCFQGGCPRNLLLIYRDYSLNILAGRINNLGDFLIAVTVLAMVIRHWRMATASRRRALVPIVCACVPTAALVIALDVVGTIAPWPDEVWNPMGQLALIALPVTFLIGLLRTHLDHFAVNKLVIELGTTPPPARLRHLLGQTLHDPSVELAYWLPEKHAFVDVQGRQVELPVDSSGRGVTKLVGRHGEPLAVLLHDTSLEENPELIRSVAAAARLSLENERLQAEICAQLEEVRASRTRLVEAADAERRRMERNLHDGAQQYLVALSLALAVARKQAGVNVNPELEMSLAEAAKLLNFALSDLRDLARGLHPKILAEAGLGPALGSLVERSVIPATVTVAVPSRLPFLIETTVYFIVAEALANVTKYAHASAVIICVSQLDEQLFVEVTDDGVGGVDTANGSGLRGLADRVAALNGRFQVKSAPGCGTRVTAEIPCV
jgi:signal transduction histidine kinase